MAEEKLSKSKWLLKTWVWSIPLGYVAMEAGWIVREVGRQPWSIYKLMRTSEGLSRLTGGEVLWTIIMFLLIYAMLFTVFIAIAIKIIRQGPDLEQSMPRLTGKTGV